MNAKSEDRNFSIDDLQEIRGRMRAAINEGGMTIVAAATESGIAYSTFSAFMNGTYSGNNDKVAGDAEIWLRSRLEKQRTARTIPTAPEFLLTPTSDAIINSLRFAQAMPDIAVIAGGAGIGKTKTADHYAMTHPNVWKVTMEPNTSSVNTMLSEVCETMGVVERSPTKFSSAIRRRMIGSGGLLIVDEAQHLTTAALDQLRTLHDRSGVGLAIIGNETVYARLEGEGRKSNFAQLFSRVGMRITQQRARPADTCALLKAWNVEDKDELKFLKAIAQKPGALRVLTKVMQVASMTAAGANEERSMKHYRAAWDRLTTSQDMTV